jgi:hypothetical protein
MQAEPLPTLQLVPLDRCVLHESIDPQRVARLTAALSAEELLRNPPVVARYTRGDSVMVLDGATRTTALRALGFAAAPVQIVSYTDARIELHTWAHILHNVNLHSLLRGLRGIAGLRLRQIDATQMQETPHEPGTIGALLSSDGDAWAIEGGGSLAEEARLLEAVFGCYVTRATIHRQPHDALLTAANLPTGTIAALYPRYTKLDLLELTHAGGIVPAGITRHVIPGRVLRLNVPLGPLRSGSVAAQQSWFAAWVAERIASGSARLYTEPTWLFDE